MNHKTPRHLSRPAKSWWRSVVTQYDCGPHELHLLTLAAEALDRCTAARHAIEAHGMTYQDPKRGPRMRPEVIIERDSRAAFARLIKQLDLDEDVVPTPGVRSHRRLHAAQNE